MNYFVIFLFVTFCLVESPARVFSRIHEYGEKIWPTRNPGIVDFPLQPQQPAIESDEAAQTRLEPDYYDAVEQEDARKIMVTGTKQRNLKSFDATQLTMPSAPLAMGASDKSHVANDDEGLLSIKLTDVLRQQAAKRPARVNDYEDNRSTVDGENIFTDVLNPPSAHNFLPRPNVC